MLCEINKHTGGMGVWDACIGPWMGGMPELMEWVE